MGILILSDDNFNDFNFFNDKLEKMNENIFLFKNLSNNNRLYQHLLKSTIQNDKIKNIQNIQEIYNLTKNNNIEKLIIFASHKNNKTPYDEINKENETSLPPIEYIIRTQKSKFIYFKQVPNKSVQKTYEELGFEQENNIKILKKLKQMKTSNKKSRKKSNQPNKPKGKKDNTTTIITLKKASYC